MPSGFTPTLKLALFSASEDGWAASMNANIRRLDTELGAIVDQVNAKIDTIEQQIAARYQDLQYSLQTQTDEYIGRLDAAREDTYDQLRTYFEAVIRPTLNTFLVDIGAITTDAQVQITKGQLAITTTETSISQMFDEINTKFGALLREIQTEAAYVDSNKAALEAKLNEIDAALNAHENDKNNPHEVSASQLLDLGQLILYQPHASDAQFL